MTSPYFAPSSNRWMTMLTLRSGFTLTMLHAFYQGSALG